MLRFDISKNCILFVVKKHNLSASIESWVLQNIESVKKLRNTPFLAFGTIDTWLVYRLTGGKVHATDYSNMSCTGLCFLIVRFYFFFGNFH
jgi:glycerol kinase